MAQEKKYYWLKLDENFFSKNKEIKKLRRLAGGDTYTIIYLKMMLFSLENAGKILYEGVGEDMAEELALLLDESAENVHMTLMFLESHGLIEKMTENEFMMTQVPLMIGKETAAAARMRKLRALKKEEAQAITEVEAPQMIEGRNNVRECYEDVREGSEMFLDIDIDKELNKDIEKEKELEQENFVLKKFNDICEDLPHPVDLNDYRIKCIRNKLGNYPVEKLEHAFQKAQKSPFLKGNNKEGWVATFDWMFDPQKDNIAKILEGNYDDRKKSMMERDGTDYAELEKMLTVN